LFDGKVDWEIPIKIPPNDFDFSITPNNPAFHFTAISGIEGKLLFNVNYTSTLKLMQIMVEKGILKRDESSMKHVYEPILEEKKAKGYLLERFLDSMYQGSASNLVMQLLGNKKTTKKELEAIKKLLSDLDNK
jgi:predicted transcriptional regulator